MLRSLRLKQLARRIKAPDARVRRRAVEALWMMRDSRTLELLISALDDDDSLVRYFAALGLGDLGDAQATTPLAHAHSIEKDPWTRVWIAVQSTRLGDASLLTDLLTDIRTVDEKGMEDWDGHPMMLAGFCNIGEKAVPILVDALDDSNATVRWLATMGLGELRATQAVEALRRVAQNTDEEETIREWATWALEQILSWGGSSAG